LEAAGLAGLVPGFATGFAAGAGGFTVGVPDFTVTTVAAGAVVGPAVGAGTSATGAVSTTGCIGVEGFGTGCAVRAAIQTSTPFVFSNLR